MPTRGRNRAVSAEMIDVDGQRIRMSVAGEGPSLLLIMGIGGNIETWRPFRSAFQRMTTIAYDAPGTGESPTSPRPMRIPALARIACAILDRSAQTASGFG